MPIRKKQSLSWFKTAAQVRHSLTDIQEMADSLKEHGPLQDVAAQADGTLIYGHRRLAAAPLAGLNELWVQVYEEPLTAAEIRIIRLVENLQRVDLTQFEVAVAVRSLVEEGMELKDVAAKLGKKGGAWATRMMYPWKCIPAAQEAFKAGLIGVTDCAALVKASVQEQQELLAAKLGGASRDELERRVRKQRNGEGAQVRRIRFALPSGVMIALASDGLTLDAAIEAMAEGIKEMRKGLAGNMDAKTFQAAMACKAKKGG